MQGRGIFSLDVARLAPDTLYALGGGCTFRSSTRGESWDSIGRHSAAFGALRVSRLDPLRIHIAADGVSFGANDIYQSTDGGISWARIHIGFTFPVDVIEYDPQEMGTLYVGVGPSSIKRSPDDGVSWQTLSQPSGAYHLSSLAIGKNNNQILYAGYYGGIFKSTDAGNTWNTLSLGFQFHSLSRVVLDPTNDNVVYVSAFTDGSVPGGMFKSTDGGQTWAEINNGLVGNARQIFCLTVNPQNPVELFIGLYFGYEVDTPMLFRTTNAGALWSPYTDGIVSPWAILSIVIDTLNQRMYACGGGAQSSGIYIHDYVSTVKTTQNSFDNIRLYQNYPNPFNQSTKVPFSIRNQGRVILTLFDVLGRRIRTIADGVFGEGSHEVELDVDDLASGVYRIRLQFEYQLVEKEIVLLK